MSVYFNKKDELKVMAETELQLRRQQKRKMSLTWLVIPKQQKLQNRLSLWTSLIP